MTASPINRMIMHTNLKQRLVLGGSAALFALLCFTFFYALWQWRADWHLTHGETHPTLLTTTGDTAATLIAAIPNEHLFGKSFSGGNVPITNLQLRVTGIVKQNTEQNHGYSKAYISMSGQPSKIYQAGDNLAYGVKVYDITPDTVILENDGHLEKLPLPREKLQFKMRTSEES